MYLVGNPHCLCACLQSEDAEEEEEQDPSDSLLPPTEVTVPSHLQLHTTQPQRPKFALAGEVVRITPAAAAVIQQAAPHLVNPPWTVSEGDVEASGDKTPGPNAKDYMYVAGDDDAVSVCPHTLSHCSIIG